MTTATDLITGDLRDELYREYDFNGRVYRINNPLTLYYRKGGTTHRVLDNEGVVHLVPAIGELGCIMRWKPVDMKRPVAW